MRVAVLGATGIIGRHTVPRLVERGHTVRAFVRHPHRASSLQALGVEIAQADILDRDSLDPPMAGCDVAVNLATSIPLPGQAGEYDTNDRIRREGTRNLLGASLEGGVRRLVQQSITFLYGDRGSELIGEDAPVQASPLSQSAVDMEEALRESPLDWIALRGGVLYGPGTGREDNWRQLAQAGRLQFVEDGSMVFSLIHITDLARAFVQAVEQGAPGTALNVVDDEPVTERELYAHVAAQIGGPSPRAGAQPGLPSLACSNTRAKSELAWSPLYPTYRSGLVL